MTGNMIEVDFRSFEHTISEDLMIRYGSPYFDRKTAGQVLAQDLLEKAVRTHSESFQFDRAQIICANEAFPETAVADALADLEIWNSWSSGLRIFPYPGKFSRLGLTHQEGKTASNTATGVIGEIFAGLFGQAGISPEVLVRNVLHWPDFIHNYTGKDQIYSFIEAKAFTNATLGEELEKRVRDSLLYEFLENCVSQLNSDPFLEIWGSFTGIVRISPGFMLTQTMIRVMPDQKKRDSAKKRLLPEALVSGLADRAIATAALGMEKDFDPGDKDLQTNQSIKRREIDKKLYLLTTKSLEAILAESAVHVAVQASSQILQDCIRKKIANLNYSEIQGATSFFDIKTKVPEMTFSTIRRAGSEVIYAACMDLVTDSNLKRTWKRDWGNANQPVGILEKHPIWLCGGSLYCLAPDNMEGKRAPIPERKFN